MALDIAMKLGLPSICGTWFFVDGKDGDDDNNGMTAGMAVKTLTKAYALCTDAYGDGICILSRSTTATSYSACVTAGFTWSKSGITVYGVCSNTFYNQRARIAFTAATTDAYLIYLTGHNTRFQNVSFVNQNDVSSEQVTTVKLATHRSAFYNCDFKCSPATASAYKCDIWFAGAHENYFEKCNFGNASYDAANNAACHIYLSGTTGNAQNLFRDCTAIAQVSTGTAFGGLKSGAATALNGLMMFNNCIFGVWQANTGMPAMASWFIGTKPTTGWIQQPCIIGYAAGDSVAGNDCIISTEPDSAAGGQIGIATA